jgi:hypothetical protein
VTVQLEGSTAYRSIPTHISGVKVKVAYILSNRLSAPITVLSNDRFLFENLILAEDKYVPSRPSSNATIRTTEHHCDVSFLPEHNKWSIQYEAACMWDEKSNHTARFVGLGKLSICK